MIALIVAYANNQVIGNLGCIPWKIKGEQKRFKELMSIRLYLETRLKELFTCILSL